MGLISLKCLRWSRRKSQKKKYQWLFQQRLWQCPRNQQQHPRSLRLHQLKVYPLEGSAFYFSVLITIFTFYAFFCIVHVMCPLPLACAMPIFAYVTNKQVHRGMSQCQKYLNSWILSCVMLSCIL